MTTATTSLPAELAHTLAARAVLDLPGNPVVCDMYDPRGAEIYHDFTLGDVSEVQDVLRVVRGTDGTILELAAGAGRLTVPLLGLRRDVIAVDLSEPMLGLLRARLDVLPKSVGTRCTPVHGDITTYTPPESVGVAVLGTTSVSLLTADQRRQMLRRTWEGLRPGGTFVLTTAQISEDATDLDERVLDVTGASGTTYRVHDVVAPDRSGRYTVVIGPGDVPTVCHSHIRVVPTGELTTDLAEAGFTVVSTSSLPGERYTSALIHAVKEA
jgi:SAM-dependent methyltransferase